MLATWDGHVQQGCLWVEGSTGQETGKPGSWVLESGVQGPERPEKVSNMNCNYSVKLPGLCKPHPTPLPWPTFFLAWHKGCRDTEQMAALSSPFRTMPSANTENWHVGSTSCFISLSCEVSLPGWCEAL